MNKRVEEAGSGDAAASEQAAGNEDVARGLLHLARTARHEPIVVILLLTATFSAISGNPVDGVLLGAVAIALGWDAARNPERAREAARGPVTAPAPAEQPPAAHSPPAGRAWTRRQLVVAGWLAAGGLYAVMAGSFIRYSWPATAAVIGVAAVAVAIGWSRSGRPRADPGKLPRAGAALWAGLLVIAGLWELAALLMQPDLTTASYAHPTISALTDPLLASHPGRSMVLATWLVVGWYLERR